VTERDFLTATRAGYDAIAADYAKRFREELVTKPVDRAMLALFAELVRAGPVVDIGCGPGRVTRYLDGLGVNAFGIDLSPEFVALAREAHPHLRFDVGTMTELELPDAGLSGLLAWYSTIHIPDEHLPQVFAEFHRVLSAGGIVLLAFQVGDEPRVFAELFGKPVSLEFRRRRPDHIAALLEQAGLHVQVRTLREPHEGTFEATPHAYLIARKPPA